MKMIWAIVKIFRHLLFRCHIWYLEICYGILKYIVGKRALSILSSAYDELLRAKE